MNAGCCKSAQLKGKSTCEISSFLVVVKKILSGCMRHVGPNRFALTVCVAFFFYFVFCCKIVCQAYEFHTVQYSHCFNSILCIQTRFSSFFFFGFHFISFFFVLFYLYRSCHHCINCLSRLFVSFRLHANSIYWGHSTGS